MPLTRAQRAAAADPAMKPRESVRDRLAQWKQLKEQNAALLNKVSWLIVFGGGFVFVALL